LLEERVERVEMLETSQRVDLEERVEMLETTQRVDLEEPAVLVEGNMYRPQPGVVHWVKF
jgi:hypothetical protein